MVLTIVLGLVRWLVLGSKLETLGLKWLNVWQCFFAIMVGFVFHESHLELSHSVIYILCTAVLLPACD